MKIKSLKFIGLLMNVCSPCWWAFTTKRCRWSQGWMHYRNTRLQMVCRQLYTVPSQMPWVQRWNPWIVYIHTCILLMMILTMHCHHNSVCCQPANKMGAGIELSWEELFHGWRRDEMQWLDLPRCHHEGNLATNKSWTSYSWILMEEAVVMLLLNGAFVWNN